MDWQAGQGWARHGGDGRGAARQFRLGQAWTGVSRQRQARCGEADTDRRGLDGTGRAWHGRQGVARNGEEWSGED